MSVQTLPAADALRQLDRFSTVIDARSEDEFALDHVPGAINWPTLDNAERITIGTHYKQVNAFEAKKRGAAIAAPSGIVRRDRVETAALVLQATVAIALAARLDSPW